MSKRPREYDGEEEESKKPRVDSNNNTLFDPTLQDIPSELLMVTIEYLYNENVEALRLTCRRLAMTVYDYHRFKIGRKRLKVDAMMAAHAWDTVASRDFHESVEKLGKHLWATFLTPEALLKKNIVQSKDYMDAALLQRLMDKCAEDLPRGWEAKSELTPIWKKLSDTAVWTTPYVLYCVWSIYNKKLHSYILWSLIEELLLWWGRKDSPARWELAWLGYYFLPSPLITNAILHCYMGLTDIPLVPEGKRAPDVYSYETWTNLNKLLFIVQEFFIPSYATEWCKSRYTTRSKADCLLIFPSASATLSNYLSIGGPLNYGCENDCLALAASLDMKKGNC